MSVQRYRLARPKGAGAAYMAKDSGGNWVEIATVAALEERVKRLQRITERAATEEDCIRSMTASGPDAAHCPVHSSDPERWCLVCAARSALAPTEEGGRDAE